MFALKLSFNSVLIYAFTVLVLLQFLPFKLSYTGGALPLSLRPLVLSLALFTCLLLQALLQGTLVSSLVLFLFLQGL